MLNQLLETLPNQTPLPLEAVTVVDPSVSAAPGQSSERDYESLWHFGQGNDYY